MSDWEKKEAIIREILTWDGALNSYDRVGTIQSFLLGWTDEESIHRITASCEQYRKERYNK